MLYDRPTTYLIDFSFLFRASWTRKKTKKTRRAGLMMCQEERSVVRKDDALFLVNTQDSFFTFASFWLSYKGFPGEGKNAKYCDPHSLSFEDRFGIPH